MAVPDISPYRPAGRISDRRRVVYWSWAAAVALIMAAGVAAGPLMSRVEEPKYGVERADGPIEVRSYGPMIAAEVNVQGGRKAALGEGFRLIAAYIFGANDPNATMVMTAPVAQQQGKRTIAMTAPVSQQADGETWTVRFIMPTGSTMANLPTPTNQRVRLAPIPARRMVVIRFSGLVTDRVVVTETDRLRKYATVHQFQTVGEPSLAFYNPPWTLPFLRRNEIMIPLAEPHIEDVHAP